MAEDFTVAVVVDESPRQVFNAVLNVRQWWQGLYSEEIRGGTTRLNDEFTFRAGGGAHYSRQKLTEVIPDKKVAWLVTESELTFLKNKTEWNGTKIVFEISRKGDKTELRFMHQGLTPQIECYDSCSTAWTRYLQERLLSLISTQKGS
ncbi:MAG TPA: SRPBCC domain-containing protein [Chryseosolibacter sp.]